MSALAIHDNLKFSVCNQVLARWFNHEPIIFTLSSKKKKKKKEKKKEFSEENICPPSLPQPTFNFVNFYI